MPVEAIAIDPRKAYNWRIEVNGLDVAYVKKCNIPELEYAKVETAHGGQRNTTKTAGKESVGDIVIEKFMPAEGSDTYMEKWRQEVRTKGADAYKRTIDIFHLGPDENGSRIDHWQAVGCWPTKLEFGDHDALSESDPIMETVTISVDELNRI